MAKISASKFRELIRRSELVEKDLLAASLAQIKEDCGGALPDGGEELAMRMVEIGLLPAGRLTSFWKAATRGSSWASTSCWAIWAGAA